MAKIISFKQKQNEPKHYINNDDNCCYKCGRNLDLDDCIWWINQRGEYGSELDGCKINIKFCDDCLQDFLDDKY